MSTWTDDFKGPLNVYFRLARPMSFITCFLIRSRFSAVSIGAELMTDTH